MQTKKETSLNEKTCLYRLFGVGSDGFEPPKAKAS